MSVTEEMKVGTAVLGQPAPPAGVDALTSSWRLDDLAAALDHAVVRVMVDSIRPDERDQVELIATARGYSMAVEAGAEAGWLSVTFTRFDDG